MVDEYHKVSVNRISPEFPMPIMWSQEHNPVYKPGGVTNVVKQLENFNVDRRLMCYTDDSLQSVLEQHNIDAEWCIHLGNGYVPIKKRFLDGITQVVRWDVEDVQYGLEDLYELQSRCRNELTEKENALQPDAIVFSDYNKGFFVGDENWIDRCGRRITIVDPKTTPLSRWEGCTIFKPNAKEARDISGFSDWQSQASYFWSEVGCETVLITMGGDGVAGCHDGCFFHYKPDRNVKVESVVGAGDCFVAGVALAAAHGFVGEEIAQIAYEIGAQYVQHGLNRPICPAEISRSGIVEPEDLAQREFKLAFTNGCFDILHSGHLQTLEYAASKGDKLVVALNSDESVRRLKGEDRPIKTLEERMRLMASLECVDFVVSFEEDTPFEVLHKILPDSMVKGAQYELENIVGADFIPEVYRAPMIEGLSSTSLLT